MDHNDDDHLNMRTAWNSGQKLEVTPPPKIDDLEELSDVNPLTFRYKRLHTYTSDGLTWMRKSGETTIMPRYSKICHEGQELKVIVCKEVLNQNLRKLVISNSEFTVSFYWLDYGTFDKEAFVVKKSRRLNEEDVDRIRNALRERDVRGAHKVLCDEGYQYDLRQIRNQKPFVKSANSRNNGPPPVTNPCLLALYASLAPEYRRYQQGGSLTTEFLLMEIFPKNFMLFLSSCPEKDVFDKHQAAVDEIIEADRDERIIKINDLLANEPEGLLFRNRIVLDTTFNLSDVYTTIIIGELANFQTASSGKSQFVLLGYSLHTKKDETVHQAFAAFLSEKFEALKDGNKSLSVLITDGEPAFKHYIEKLGCYHLRCEMHLAENMKRISSTKSMENAKPIIFGSKIDGALKPGVLYAFEQDELDDRIQKAEKMLDPSIYSWLKRNNIMLFGQSSFLAKLRCGVVQQFSTSNNIEAFNAQIKLLLRRKKTGDQLAKFFFELAHKQYREMYKSMFGASSTVVYRNVAQFTGEDHSTQKKTLESLGFSTCRVANWTVPPNLENVLNWIFIEKEEEMADDWQVQPHAPVFILTSKNGDNKYLLINRADDDTLECATCGHSRPVRLCRHLIATLDHLTENERTEELLKYGKAASEMTTRQTMSLRQNSKKGRKPGDRKGRQGSKHNRKRHINAIAENSLFDTLDEDDEEEEDDEIDEDEEDKEEDEIDEDEEEDEIDEPIDDSREMGGSGILMSREMDTLEEMSEKSVAIDENTNQIRNDFENISSDYTVDRNQESADSSVELTEERLDCDRVVAHSTARSGEIPSFSFSSGDSSMNLRSRRSGAHNRVRYDQNGPYVRTSSVKSYIHSKDNSNA